MTLDEAIQHCQEKVQEQAKKGCYSCAEEHQQLAEWLKELKDYRENICGDAISRQAVLEGLRTCYDTETKEYSDGSQWINYEDAVAEMEDLPSVTPKTCDNCISRAEVKKLADEIWDCYGHEADEFDADDCYELFLVRLKNLPSVSPQPKIGRWIPLEYDGYADGNPVWDKWECSECGWEHEGDEDTLTAYCPNCGAEMEVKADD